MITMVRFTPCASTDRHSHTLGQTLHIVSGTALIGTRDGTIIEARPGDTVHTPPGEKRSPTRSATPRAAAPADAHRQHQQVLSPYG
ncbi:cupin domain-containing protein [Streptomyces avermitilis]